MRKTLPTAQKIIIRKLLSTKHPLFVEKTGPKVLSAKFEDFMAMIFSAQQKKWGGATDDVVATNVA